MIVRRTVVFPIAPVESQLKALEETRALYSKACNYCADVAWEMENPNGSSVHKATYYNLKSELCLKSQYLCSARNKAVEAVRSAKVLTKKGKKVSKPNFETIPFRLDGRTLSFDKLRETASIATQHGRIKITLHWHKQAQRYKLWNCKAGEVGIDRNGRWVLWLVFEKEVVCPDKTGKIIGGDRGIKKPLVTSDNRFLGKRKWKEREKKYLSHIARLQSKGTKSAKRHLKKKGGKLRRFKQDCDRIVAKELIAGLEPGDTFVQEKLTGIRDSCGIKGKAHKKHRRHMGRWSFKRLENCINSTAELVGIYVEYVDPKNTSRMCSRCGIVSKKNRKTQSIYSCSCGFELNADLNAARNIAQKWRMANGYANGLSVNQPIVAGVFSNAFSYKPPTSVGGS